MDNFKINFKKILIFILFFFSTINLYPQLSDSNQNQYPDSVIVLPGIGIIFNHDSILLRKTSLNDINIIFNKKRSKPIDLKCPQEKDYAIFLPQIENIEDTIYYTYYRFKGGSVKFKSINLFIGSEFSKKTNKYDNDSLIVRCIEISEDKSLHISFHNGLFIGSINPNIPELFPVKNEKDYIITPNFIDLVTYGLWLKFDGNPAKLTEITVFPKLKITN